LIGGQQIDQGWSLRGGLVCLISVYGLTRIEVKNDLIGNFMPGASVRTQFEVINDRLGGANSFAVVIAADKRDAFKQPENLRFLEDLQTWLESNPLVGSVTSVVDHVKVINWGFHDNDPAHMAVPKTAKLTDQLLLFGATEAIEEYVDSRYQVARVVVRARTSDSGDLRRLFDAIRELYARLPLSKIQARFRFTRTISPRSNRN